MKTRSIILAGLLIGLASFSVTAQTRGNTSEPLRLELSVDQNAWAEFSRQAGNRGVSAAELARGIRQSSGPQQRGTPRGPARPTRPARRDQSAQLIIMAIAADGTIAAEHTMPAQIDPRSNAVHIPDFIREFEQMTSNSRHFPGNTLFPGDTLFPGSTLFPGNILFQANELEQAKRTFLGNVPGLRSGRGGGSEVIGIGLMVWPDSNATRQPNLQVQPDGVFFSLSERPRR
ncbi:MAG: hypothetical protein ACXIUL_12240 [Wenzhouxiangella sp.]